MAILILGIFFHISPVHGLFYHCIIVIHVFILTNVCVIHTLCSAVALHLGNFVMYISYILFVIALPSSLLTCIHKNGLISHLFELVVTCTETNIFVPSFSISHIPNLLESLSVVFHFTLNILQPKTCIQHQLYTVFEII